MLAEESAFKSDFGTKEEKPTAEAVVATRNDGVVDTADEVEAAILNYLKRAGSVSPGDIQSALDLSKATAFRRLQQLVQTGTVTRTGKTASIRYRLAHKNTDKRQGQTK